MSEVNNRLVEDVTHYTEVTGASTVLMPAPNASSGPRVAMEGTHLPQTVPIVGAEPRLFFTGAEFEYAKHTFNIVAPANCEVKRIIRRMPAGSTDPSEYLETVVFVKLVGEEVRNSNSYDIIVIPKYLSNHQYFGFNYVLTEAGRNLRVGQVLRAGTVLADTPSVIDGEYCQGVNLAVAIVANQNVIEDAVLISQSAADKMNAYGFKTFVGKADGGTMPLFLYKDENGRCIIHPRVGEKVRPDGILMATRSYDPIMAAVEATVKAMQDPCGHFDDPIYVDKESEVIDIKVYSDPYMRNKMRTPPNIQEICDPHAASINHFYDNILDFYKTIRATSRRPCNLSHEASQLIERAIAWNPAEFTDRGHRVKQFGFDLLGDYRIELTVRYPIPLDGSGKLSDTFGGKGIVAKVVPDDEMPYDDYGNRVDLVVAENAVIRRTIFNRPLEPYVNAAARDVRKRMLAMYDDKVSVEEIWDYFIKFAYIIHEENGKVYEESHPTLESREAFIRELRHKKIRNWFPIDYDVRVDEIEENIMKHYPPMRSPLNYLKADGTWSRTIDSILIGDIYIIRLDKTGRDMSAANAGRYQSFGTIAKQHAHDRHTRPGRENPMTFQGESEARHMEGYVGRQAAAEHHDMANNPVVARTMIRNIITADAPMNIPSVIDRDEMPLGNTRPMAIVRHLDECDGVAFTTELD